MLSPDKFYEYELIDHGDVRKLERFGSKLSIRPEPSAVWNTNQDVLEWDKASLIFEDEKGWVRKPDNEEWIVTYKLGKQSLKFLLKPSSSKHVGIFPEQAVNWDFIYDQCLQLKKKIEEPKVLNLFAYTGAASLAASTAGALVTHVDSSASVVNWAKRNAELNDITNIRWIVEDARKFVEKCVRRGDVFHGVIMDPPIFGLAKKGQAWKLNRDLEKLLIDVMQVLDPKHCFFVLNTYSPQLPMNKLVDILNKVHLLSRKYEKHTLGLVSKTGKELPLGNLIRYKR